MTISARNILKGRITRILDGAVNCEITLEVAPGIQVVSIITKSSTESLGLAVGDAAYAVIKASDVMIAIDG
jgi:molybdopterin-binding protein